MTLVGGAGTGKSALAAALIRPELAPGIVFPGLVDALVFASVSPTATEIAAALAAQLGRVAGFAEAAELYRARADPKDLDRQDALTRLVVGPLRELQVTGARRLRLIVDGLDQLDGAARDGVIAAARTLASEPLLSGVRVLLTGRPESLPTPALPGDVVRLGTPPAEEQLAVLAGGYGLATTPLRAAQLGAFGVLLPPVYALLAPALLTAVKQLRVGRSPLHRRVFSAAVIGLEGYGRATLYQLLAGGPLSEVVHRGDGPVALALVAALGIGFGAVQLNALAVAVAVRLNSPEVGWRELLWQPSGLRLDGLELSVGLVIAAGWTVSPVVVVLALPAMVALQRTFTYDQLRAAARTDAKTGLLNAASWQEEADREIGRAGTPLTVLIADLDQFKGVNDRHGHLVGDRVIAAAAGALRAGCRSYDLLGRFGGEEFVVLLPGTDRAEAARITDRLRQLVAAAAVPAGPAGAEPVRVTVSIGAAVLGRHGADLTDLLVAADLALYRAKAAGRNRVSFAASR